MMYREIRKALPRFVKFREFMLKVKDLQLAGYCPSDKERAGYLDALAQLNPADDRWLRVAIDEWRTNGVVAREMWRSDDGGQVMARYDAGVVQILAVFAGCKKAPRLKMYTLISGRDGRLHRPQFFVMGVPLVGFDEETEWGRLLNRIPKMSDDEYFTLCDGDDETIYFQAWVNPKKDGHRTIDVEYCLGPSAFHFKTQIRSLNKLKRMVNAVKEGGIPAVQGSVNRWVQILPDYDGDKEW